MESNRLNQPNKSLFKRRKTIFPRNLNFLEITRLFYANGTKSLGNARKRINAHLPMGRMS